MGDIVLESSKSEKRIWMAAKYEIEYINGVPIRIKPSSNDIVSKPINNSKILKDFLDLIKECGIEGKKTYEHPFYMPSDDRVAAYVKRKQRYEKRILADKLVGFCNQWGLFGIMHDEAKLSYGYTDEIGGHTLGANPYYAIKQIDPDDPLNFGTPVYQQIPYREYAKRYFPDFNGRFYPHKQYSKEFLVNYSESIESILFNHRFMSAVKYVMDFRNDEACSMTIENMNFRITRNNNKISYTETPQTTIELLQLLMYINETSGNDREYGICARCGAPYLYNVCDMQSFDEATRHRKYCGARCRKNANRHPKKGDKINA